MSQTSKLTKSLKMFLKSRGYTYSKLANDLTISEASVKRLFSEESFSLKRIEEICNLLDVNFLDLARSAFASDDLKMTKLSEEQERHLAQNPKILIYLYLLLQKWTTAEIDREYRFTKTESEKLLLQLDKMGLIEFHSSNKVILKAGPFIDWSNDGPVRQLFEKHVKDEFMMDDFTDSENLFSFSTGELSSASIKLIRRKVQKLVIEIKELIETDAGLPKKETKSIGMLFAIRPWVFSVFQKQKRNSL